MSEKFRELLNVYTFTCELPGTGEEITFKPLTTAQIKNLLTYENEKNLIIQERAIDEVISRCVLTEGFNVSNIFLEDRFFLLLQIRKKSKGEFVEFKHDCEQCGSQTLASINLDDLPVIKRNPDENPVVDLQGGFKLKLRHVIRADYMHLNPKILKGLSDSQAAAEMQIIIFAVGIDSITTEQYGEETNLPLEDKKFLLENIPTSEYQKVADWYDKNNFGVDFNTTIKCIKCSNEIEIVVPLDKAFFL